MNNTLGILKRPPQLAELKEGQAVTVLLFPKQLGGGAPAENQYRQYMRVGGKLLSWTAKDMSKVDFAEVFPSTVQVNDIPAGTADYDKFLVSDGGMLRYRTAAQMQSDMGLAAEGEAHSLSDHADVAFAGPVNLDVLQYNGTNWVDRSLAEAGISGTGHEHTLANITDLSQRLDNLTDAEVQQLETIGVTTISAAQWGYLGELDQTLKQAASPTFVNLTLSGVLNTPEVKAASGAGLKLYDDGGNGIFVKDGGYVSIGTISPYAKLFVWQPSAFDTAYDSQIDNVCVSRVAATGLNAVGGSIGFTRVYGTPTSRRAAAIAAVITDATYDAQTGLALYVHPSASSAEPIVEKVRITHGGYVGLSESAPDKLLTLADQGDTGSKTFSPGWAGTGWYLDWLDTHKYHLELESMTIRGPLNVYEMIINTIHSVDGGMIISKAHARVASVASGTHPNEVIVIEDPSAHGASPFKKGDIVMVQRVAIDETSVVRKEQRQVKETYTSGLTIPLEATAGGEDNANIQAGDVLVILGNIEGANGTTGRDASIFLSASETNNPFIRFKDGVHSVAEWNGITKIVAALGNLNGVYGYDTEVYGFAAGNPAGANLTIDPTLGIRFRLSEVVLVEVGASVWGEYPGMKVTGGVLNMDAPGSAASGHVTLGAPGGVPGIVFGSITDIYRADIRRDSDGFILSSHAETGIPQTDDAAYLKIFDNGAVTLRAQTEDGAVRPLHLYGDLVNALRAPNGTAGAPVYTFTNDPNTGIYRYSADALGITANGVVSVLFSVEGIYPAVLGTTASAANLYCSGALSSIKRSTAGRRADKANIRSIEIDTNKVYDLNPISFASKLDLDRKGKPIDGFFGLIAEEVHETLPNLCGYNEKGEPDWVQYQMLPVLMLPEMKKLRDRISGLESQVATLKQQIALPPSETGPAAPPLAPPLAGLLAGLVPQEAGEAGEAGQ